jgi:glycosyltransferase involved in cell wall biosynthesis
MKIMVVAASSSTDISGIQRHALNLVRCLMRSSEITGVDLIVAPWQTKITETLKDISDPRLIIHFEQMGDGSAGRNLWYYRELPLLVRRFQVDLVHLSYPVPVHATAFGCPTVLSLHDLYPLEVPENFGFPKAWVNRWILQQCLRNVSSIACVSDATLHKVKQYWPGKTEQKAVRIYNCVEPLSASTTSHAHRELINQRFLLSVSQHRKNKNIPLLIRAFHRLLKWPVSVPVTKLVVVGIEGPETQSICSLITHLRLDKHVLLVRGLSENELQWCYGHCEAVVAPSKTEGFGLPIAEALLAGARVVCSDIAAFREIGDPHCRFVDLAHTNELGLARAIAETINRPSATRISFPQLSAETLSREYVQLYTRLLLQKQTAAEASARAGLCTIKDGVVIQHGSSTGVRKWEG